MNTPGGHRLYTASLVLACSLLLSGCGSDGDTSETSGTVISTPPPPMSEPTPIPTPTPKPLIVTDPKTQTTPALERSPTTIPEAPMPSATIVSLPTQAPMPTTTPSKDYGYVGRVTLTRGIDSRQRPTEPAAIFGEQEQVYVSVEFIEIRKDAILGVRWRQGDSELFVFELPPSAAFSRGFFAFYFNPGGPGSAGSYSVEILISDEVAARSAFEVRPGTSAKPQG